MSIGQTTNLTISARTGGQLTNQWYFNSSPILGATGTNLIVDNFNYAKAGVYAVHFGNAYTNAMVNCVLRLANSPAVLVDGVDVGGGSFLNWTGDSASTSNFATVLMDRPRAVQAVCGTSLNLFTGGNGQVLLNPATGPCAFGSSVQLTALPAAGSYFFGWGGAASGFANPLFITATNAAGSTALFGTLNPNQVPLTALPNGNGAVSVSPGKNVCTNGETVTLTAVPGAHRVFKGWSGGAAGSLNPLGFTLTASTVIRRFYGLNRATVGLPMGLISSKLFALGFKRKIA